MIVFPNCKINIGLNIISKRNDGYHNIETVFYPIPLCDVLEIIVSENSTEIFTSGIIIPESSNENICLKAYNLLRNHYQLPEIKIYLHKNIPIGAGLGGGSADAAFIIKAINEKFSLNIPEIDLLSFARQLGADCAFFINNKPVYGTEKGDVFKDLNINLKGKYLYLIKPPIFISTKEAYQGVYISSVLYSIDKLIQEPIESWKTHIKNDFETEIFKKYPYIKQIKEGLYQHGAIYASMSGSGSAVYGIFNQKLSQLSNFSDCFHYICEL